MTELTTDFNVSPYFDDFVENAEPKNYHRVLFKPSIAVQARELTTIQSILQNQIARFGDNIYVDGTIVDGGNFVENRDIHYAKILDNNTNDQPVVMTQYNNRFAVGLVSGIRAKVVQVSVGLESQTPDLNTLYLNYLTTSDSGQKVFIAGENIEIQDEIGNVIDTLTIAGVETSPIGRSYGLKCGDGIVYQKGHFIKFYDHLLIVSKYTNQPNGVCVGFDIVEDIVNSFSDTTLLDNSAGFNNYNAPGADRLRLIPQLIVLTNEEADSRESFLKIQEYQNGKVVRRRTDTQFNSINKELRRRTMEESGNYSLGEIPISVKDNVNDPTILDVVVGKSVAYVEGQRIESIENYTAQAPKPIEFQIESNQNVLTNIGHYVVANSVSGTFSFSSMNQIDLLSAADAVIGKANLRGVSRHSDTESRFYLFNVRMNSGQNFNNVRKIKQATSVGTLVLESGKPVIKDFAFKAALFSLGKTAVKTLPSEDTNYISRQTTTGTVAGTTLTISLSSGEFPYGNAATLNTDQKNELLLWLDGTVTSLVAPTIVTNADATVLTITFANSDNDGKTAVLAHDVKYDNAVASKKTLSSVYVKVNAGTNQAGVTGNYSLGLPDVYAIEGIWMGTGTYSETNPNVTSNFTLFPNQKDDLYGHSFIKKKAALTIPSNATLLIKVKVFRKDATNSFYTVDSYPIDDSTTPIANTIRTEDIPNYTMEGGSTVDLRNVIDFRPYVTATAAYSANAAGATIVTKSVENEAMTAVFPADNKRFCSPNKYLESTYQYYIGRKDRVMLTDEGRVEIIQGIASERPVLPGELTNGMTIATLDIPPYPSLPYTKASKIKKVQYGITMIPQKNRRYTMRDVARIDERVSQLEYYTVLNALEKSADDMTITDSNGLDRFKNGIVVDSFANFAVANTNHAEFSAGIDPAFQELTPQFRNYPIELEMGTATNVIDHGEVATLDYTKHILIDQPTATKSRSCTSGFYSYVGTARLRPEYDAEPDVSRAPDVNIDIDLGTVFADFTEALSDFVPLSSVDRSVISSVISSSSRLDPTNTSRTTTTKTKTTTTTTTKKLTSKTVTSQEKVGDFVTDVNFSPWLRGRHVQILVQGLRPNTRFYFWFDGQDITQHVYPATGVNLKSLVIENKTHVVKSAANGSLRAIFVLPPETFKVGDRLLEMYDVPLYNSVEDATSSASITYSGYNFSYEKTAISTTTRTPKFDTSTKTTSTSAVTTNTTTRRLPGRGNGTGGDPIAMTFYVDPEMTPDTDLFVDSLDLYFAAKGTNNGVRVQLRETDNGYPGNHVLPFSEVILEPSAVNVSNNGTVATKVVFDAPVALKKDTEYSIVIIPLANDPDYRVWVSKIGEKDLVSGTVLTQDVSSGTLFTSTNSTAWTAYQGENLKYRLYSCRFVSSGTVRLRPKDYEFFSIQNVTGTFTEGEKVFAQKSNLSGNVAVLAGNTTITGTGTTFSNDFAVGDYIVVRTRANVYEPHRVMSIANNTSMMLESTIQNGNTASTYYMSQVGELDYINTRAPQRLHLKHSSVRAGRVFTTGATLVGADSGATAVIAAIENQRVSYIQPHIYKNDFSKTRTTMQLNMNGNNYAAEYNDNKYLTGNQHYIYSRSNQIAAGIGDTFGVTLTLRNTESNAVNRTTSPFIDYDISTMGVFEYLIDQNNDAAYIAKVVTLTDGLDAEDLKFFVTGYRPSGTNIDVYIKFLAATDPTPMTETPWTKLVLKAGNTFFSSNADRFNYKEFEYSLPTTAKSAGQGAWVDNNDQLNYISEDGAVYNNFKFFEIKINMTSNNFNRVPRCADMRGIALS